MHAFKQHIHCGMVLYSLPCMVTVCGVMYSDVCTELHVMCHELGRCAALSTSCANTTITCMCAHLTGSVQCSSCEKFVYMQVTMYEPNGTG